MMAGLSSESQNNWILVDDATIWKHQVLDN
jgi:hypothetical protein